MYALGRSFGGDDSTEVEPCTNYLIEVDMPSVQQRANPAECVRRDFVAPGGRGSGNDHGTVGPGQAIVPDQDKLLVHSFNLDIAPATPDAVGLDRQQFAITRRLGDVTSHGQIGAVELVNDLAALVDLAGVS